LFSTNRIALFNLKLKPFTKKTQLTKVIQKKKKTSQTNKLLYTYTPIYYLNILLSYNFDLTFPTQEKPMKPLLTLKPNGDKLGTTFTQLLFFLLLILFFYYYVHMFFVSTPGGIHFQLQKFGVQILLSEVLDTLPLSDSLTSYLTILLF